MNFWKITNKTIKLQRYPFAGEQCHRAWDAADDWIVKRFPSLDCSIIIVGEDFGALSVAWGETSITSINDSFLSFISSSNNRVLNPEINYGSYIKLPLTQKLEKQSFVDKIFIRLPKRIELLEIYFKKILDFCSSDTQIWIGGMDKRWNSGSRKLIKSYFNIKEEFPFSRHSKWLKAEIMPSLPKATPTLSKETFLTAHGISIQKSPVIFSGKVIDRGTETFLKNFPVDAATRAGAIADLGCGSGMFGLKAAKLNEKARLFFTDESFLAVEAAEKNFFNNFTQTTDSRLVSFLPTNGLESLPDSSLDLVLCNPPFHFKNIQTREVSAFMFAEAKRCLKNNGMIQIVGNNHLGYHKLLKDYFSKVKLIFKDDKFSVLRGLSD